MRSPTALNTSLVSLAIILAGVLLIIFIQIDRGYALAGPSSVSFDEQMRLLDKVHQLNQQEAETLNLAKPAPIQQTEAEKFEAFDFESPYVRNTSVADEFDQLYVLRNNPWSPDYQPPR
jgi:hypothetical protein